MTRLERHLAKLDWMWSYDEFSAVHDGRGYLVFRVGSQMWAAGISKENTAVQLATHTKKWDDPRKIIFRKRGLEFYCSPMFVIPATPELVSAVVLHVYPEVIE